MIMKKIFLPAIATLLVAGNLSAVAATNALFTGRIEAALTGGGEVQKLFYTAGTNCVRIEPAADGQPNPVDLVDRASGALTLLFPHNRSFVRLKNEATIPLSPNGLPPMTPPAGVGSGTFSAAPGVGAPPGMPVPPQMPPGVGPQPGGGGIPVAMPMMPMETAKLTATTDTTNLLGYACTRYELKQRGEVMEIWATDKLMPFQAYQQNQPHRFGPRMMEEQWGEMLKSKKLFPLLAVLKFENGPERLRFEVRSVKPEAIADKDGSLFQPPTDYNELNPLPF